MKLPVEVFKCPKCNKPYPIDQPIIWRDYRGYESAVHECGPGFTAVVVIPRSERAKRVWREIMDAL